MYIFYTRFGLAPHINKQKSIQPGIFPIHRIFIFSVQCLQDIFTLSQWKLRFAPIFFCAGPESTQIASED